MQFEVYRLESCGIKKAVCSGGVMAKILIVDDSSLSRRILKRILQDSGYDVIEAQDGVAALEQYFLEKPDLVLLDLIMAGMSGWEVLEKLLQLDKNACIVLATADIQNSTKRMGEEKGASGFLTKPFETESVLQSVDLILRNRQLNLDGRSS
jgi:two-component system chemotaxis response regulator CheY